MLKTLALLFLVISVSYASIEKSNPLYNFQGQCETDDNECLPYSNISFKNIWTGLKLQTIIDSANKFIEQNTPKVFKRKIFVEESRLEPGTLGLFADQTIDFNDTIATFDEDLIISNNYKYRSFRLSDAPNDFVQFPELPLNRKNQNFIIMALNLLYHLYNFQKSPLKDELITFPQQPDIPAFTFSEYELALLKDDPMNLIVRGLRVNINQEYDTFIQLIQQHWTEEQIKLFTNGRATIIKDDFVYAYSIVFSQSFTDRNYKEDKTENIFVSLAPIVHLAKLFKEKPETKQMPYAYYFAKKNQVKYTANEFYERDDEIFQHQNDLGNEILLPIHKLLVPKNPNDCIWLSFLSAELAEEVGLKQNACVNEKSSEISQYYLTGNLINMSEEEQKACNKKTEPVSGDLGKMIKIMYEQCPHPSWDKYDVFELAREQIQNQYQFYHSQQKKVSEYLYLRQKDKLNKENGYNIKYYFQQRLEVARGIIKRFDKLDEISGTLKKLNTKLEEKLKKEGKWGKQGKDSDDEEDGDLIDDQDDEFFEKELENISKKTKIPISKKKKRETKTNIKTDL